jgi:hypothetical protein
MPGGVRDPQLYPDDYDSNVYQYASAGDVPLTAITDKAGEGVIEGVTHRWYEQEENTGVGTLVRVYTDAAMTTPYSTGLAAGDIVYVGLDEVDAKNIQEKQLVTIWNSTTMKPVRLDVRACEAAGAASRAVCKLLNADTENSLTASANALVYVISGNAQREMSELPGGKFFTPVKYENQTEILMASVETSGTEEAIKKYADTMAFDKQTMMCLADLKAQIEMSFIFSVLHTEPENGFERRYSRGLYEALELYKPTHIINCATVAGMPWSGKTFAEGGLLLLDWLNEEGAKRSKASGKEYLCGNGFFTKINQLIRGNTSFEMTSKQSSYGFSVTTITGFHQDIRLLRHPLLSRTGVLNQSALVLESGLLKRMILKGRGLKFISGKNPQEDAYCWVDGKKRGWMIEHMPKWNNLDCIFWLDKFGEANSA